LQRQLARLVESLLTLARSDAGELPLQKVNTDAGKLVENVLEPYQEVAAERGLSLVAECSAAVQVSADPLWLGRAVANLIDNACKFTPRGGRVAVKVEASDNRVWISVEDDGPGLAQGERSRAFERFYRGEAMRGATDGFGLGLPMAREIIEALGGDLRLEDRPSGGTIAKVELPHVGARPA
jgi:signal transduction histidine kinase